MLAWFLLPLLSIARLGLNIFRAPRFWHIVLREMHKEIGFLWQRTSVQFSYSSFHSSAVDTHSHISSTGLGLAALLRGRGTHHRFAECAGVAVHDLPVVVQRQIPMVFETIQKTVLLPKVQCSSLTRSSTRWATSRCSQFQQFHYSLQLKVREPRGLAILQLCVSERIAGWTAVDGLSRAESRTAWHCRTSSTTAFSCTLCF